MSLNISGVPDQIVYLVGSGQVHILPEISITGAELVMQTIDIFSVDAIGISYSSDGSGFFVDNNTEVYDGTSTLIGAFNNSPANYLNLLIYANDDDLSTFLQGITVDLQGVGGDNSVDFYFTIREAGSFRLDRFYPVVPIVYTTSNTAPTVTLSPSASNLIVTENGTAVDVFANVAVSTVETGQKIVDFNLTVTHADAGNDVLTVDGTAITLSNGANGNTAGHGYGYTVTIGQDGVAHLTFTSTTGMYEHAFSSMIDAVSFLNGSDDPSAADRVISLEYLRDNGGVANNGHDGLVTSGLDTTIHVTAVNDAPTVSTAVSTALYVEDGAPVSVFSATTIDTVEAGQTIIGVTLAVEHVEAGTDVLTIDGMAIALVDGSHGTTSANGVGYSITISGGTATLTLSKAAGLSVAATQSLIDGITFHATSQDPSTQDRDIVLTGIQDSGGTANGGIDATSANYRTVVHVEAVDDAATVALTDTVTSLSEGASTGSHFKVANITISDVDGGSNALSLTGADAAMFEIENGQLYLKSGVTLDFETNKFLDVTVNVDTAAPGSPDDSQNLRITLTDVVEPIIGNNRPNLLTGSSNGELIDGRGGNDTIRGNGGDDTIVGGRGSDQMSGGAGKDVFVFKDVSDSPVDGPNNQSWWNRGGDNGHHDVISGFVHGADKIDLSAIDADPSHHGNQAFAFRGTGGVVHQPGQLYVRYFSLSGRDVTIVSADTDGDGVPDLQIELKGHIGLTGGDFVL